MSCKRRVIRVKEPRNRFCARRRRKEEIDLLHAVPDVRRVTPRVDVASSRRPADEID